MMTMAMTTTMMMVQVFKYTMGIKLKSVPPVQKVCERGHCFDEDDDEDDDDDDDDDASLEIESGLFITLGNGTFGDQIEKVRTLCSPQICILGVFPQLVGKMVSEINFDHAL